MLNRTSGDKPKKRVDQQGPIPALCLRDETEDDLLALQHADSITVDPHKAGYIPYPAGSLVYRNGRMRHLVTWSSPTYPRDQQRILVFMVWKEGELHLQYFVA